MRRFAAVVACLLLAVAGGVKAQDFATVADAATAFNLTTLLQVADGTLISEAAIDPEFKGIVLAPTNEAFAKLNASLPGGLNSLTPEQVLAVLQYHVIASAEDFPYINNMTRSVNETLLSSQASDTLNGNVSFVPFTMNGTEYVYAGGIAPGAVTSIVASTTAAKARVYVIEDVLLPPTTDMGGNYPLTVAQAVQNDPNFSFLLGAVAADPEILGLLSDPDATYTIFAPTNEAFTKFLEAANLTLADAPSLAGTPQVNRILKNHVLNYVPVLSTSLAEGEYTLPTLSSVEADVVNVTKSGDAVTVQGANNPEPVNVIIPNVLAGKSVIHVIDGVILPSDEGSPAEPPAGGDSAGSPPPAEETPAIPPSPATVTDLPPSSSPNRPASAGTAAFSAVLGSALLALAVMAM